MSEGYRTSQASQRPNWTSVAADPDAVMQIKHLPLRARVVVEGFFHGLHASPLFGFSSEFSEYRQYTAGDDTRYIDWRLYARTDRHFIKRFEDETNRACMLVVDQSRSMGYGSGDFTKSDYTRTLAATLAYWLNLQRDCVGLLTYDADLQDYLSPRYRTGHLRRLMSLLERAEQGTATDIGGALERVAAISKKRGLVVLLSDFLAPIETLRVPFTYLRSRGHEVWAVRILDPLESSFEFADRMTLVDLETGMSQFVDTQTEKRRYLQRFRDHARALAEVCTDLGIDLSSVHTDEPLKDILFMWQLRHSQTSGRPVHRRTLGQGRVR
ncbi:MAG: DUF58 domain-containing protein [Planctomycetaceae bacterium]|nr:DUF58 domain-containing protein [Planctomycetaceae bacterium]